MNDKIVTVYELQLCRYNIGHSQWKIKTKTPHFCATRSCLAPLRKSCEFAGISLLKNAKERRARHQQIL